MTDSVKDLVSSIMAGNMSAAGDAFKSAINDRMQDSLDAKKIEIASQLYSGTATAVDSESADEVINTDIGVENEDV